jgi:hypothetical protein
MYLYRCLKASIPFLGVVYNNVCLLIIGADLGIGVWGAALGGIGGREGGRMTVVGGGEWGWGVGGLGIG